MQNLQQYLQDREKEILNTKVTNQFVFDSLTQEQKLEIINYGYSTI